MLYYTYYCITTISTIINLPDYLTVTITNRLLSLLYLQNVVLGKTSLSAFGFYGALFEILIIFYILIASLAGLYSSCPRLRPERHDTDMTKLVYNCGVFLILSSALPVLCRILGKPQHQRLFGSINYQSVFTSFVFWSCLPPMLVMHWWGQLQNTKLGK